jgi:hypothetical protein
MGAVVIGYMQAHAEGRSKRFRNAQSMDALSSQASVAGYKAVLIAANTLQKVLPMLTTAAGTIRPAQVLIIGAGVAGLQAIATAKRLGAVVEAYDVRSATKEQVKSLGREVRRDRRQSPKAPAATPASSPRGEAPNSRKCSMRASPRRCGRSRTASVPGPRGAADHHFAPRSSA